MVNQFKCLNSSWDVCFNLSNCTEKHIHLFWVIWILCFNSLLDLDASLLDLYTVKYSIFKREVYVELYEMSKMDLLWKCLLWYYEFRGRNSGRLSVKADSIPEKANRSHIRFREKSRFDFTAKCEIFCKYYT